MKKITITALILSAILLFSACEKQQPNDTSSSTSTVTETSTDIANDAPSKTVSSLTVKDLVEEMEQSKGKEFHYPKLNEKILGERAKKFNKEMQLIYKDALEAGLHDEEGGELAQLVRYFPYIDQERQLFSIAAHFVQPGGYSILDYGTAVFDLNDPSREVSFTEVLKSFGWEPNRLRDRIHQYFVNLYAVDSRAFFRRQSPDFEGELAEYEVFLNNRMKNYDSEFQEGLPFSLDKEGLTVYFTSAYPSFMESHTERYLLKENVIDDLFANETFGSIMAIVNDLTEEERAKLNIVDEVRQEGVQEGTEEKVFIALEDNVDFYLMNLNFDAELNTTVPTETIFRRTLNKGEAVSVHALIPEGIPQIQATAEFRPEDMSPEEGSYSLFYPFAYDGLLGDTKIKIEFLQGDFSNG